MIGHKKSTITVLLIVILLFKLVGSQEAWDEDQFYADLEQANINPQLVTGCGPGCGFDTATNTLTLTTGATLSDVPDGLTANLNGGSAFIPGATLHGQGTYTTEIIKGQEERVFLNGNIQLDQDFSQTNLFFENTEIEHPDGAIIKGDGYVYEGNIIIHKANLKFQGQTSYVEDFWFEIIEHQGIKSISGEASDNFKFGGPNDYITFEKGTLVLIGGNQIGAIKLTAEGEPALIPATFTIMGKPTVNIIQKHGLRPLEEEGRIIAYETDSPDPGFFILDNKKHPFLGSLKIDQGQIIIESDPNLQQMHMVDGVYINPSVDDVYIYFDDQEHIGNFVQLGDSLTLSGQGFTVALSEKTRKIFLGPPINDEVEVGGFPTREFPYLFRIGNDYVKKPKKEGSPYRLVLKMNGGKVTINKDNTATVTGGVMVLNGLNEITYYESEPDLTEFDYRYVGCGGGAELSLEKWQESCTEAPVTFSDGGTVNVVRDEGIPIKKETGVEEITIDTFRTGTQTYLLDKSSVYVLGYKGGDAAEQLFGPELAEYEWGHVGLLYYRDGKWWVTESEGQKTIANPLDRSLFRSKIHGLWEVVDDEGNPIDPDPVVRASERMVAIPYDVGPGDEAIHCTEVVCKGIEASLGKEFEGKISFEDIPKPVRKKLTSDIITKINMAKFFTTIPREILMNNPNLKKVEKEPLKVLVVK